MTVALHFLGREGWDRLADDIAAAKADFDDPAMLELFRPVLSFFLVRLLLGRKTVTHDVTLIRWDGSVRNFRVYDRPIPKDGDIITLPVDGQLTKARVRILPEKPEMAHSVDAEALEI